MDVGRSGPGPVDGSLLTLQSVHRSQVVWDNKQAPPNLRVRTNYGEYWKTVRTHIPHQRIMDAIRDLAGEDDVNRGGLKIKWVVDNFGSCERLEQLDTAAIGYGVQVWIYERFPSLAPRHTGEPLSEYPLALRYVITPSVD
ncbi:hypothetical protein ACET3Z_027165 [Daucus carota]